VQAVVIEDGQLGLRERPDPEPRGREVLVRVRATSVNRADLLQRAGRYPAPAGAPADVPGLEVAGEVATLGPTATGWEVGQRVMALVPGGGHAELVCVEDDQLVGVPDALDDVTAGASMEVFATAWDALVWQAGMRAGETVLIHAVGSGVGTAAVQLCRAVGARPVGTSRTPGKLDRARELGMVDGAVVADPADRAAKDAVRALGEPDVVLDLVGGDYLSLDARVAAPQARIVLVGLLAGGSTDLPLGAVLAKRLVVRGTVLRSRAHHEKAGVARGFAREVVPLLADGRVAPVVEQVLPLARATEAYDLVGSNTTVGKVVLTT